MPRRAASQSPVRGSGRKGMPSSSQKKKQAISTLTEILKNDDVDALIEFAGNHPDMMTSTLKFHDVDQSLRGGSVALAVAVTYGSWDVAEELVFTIWPESGIDIDDLELEWRDDDQSLASLLKTEGMPRLLKKRLAKAVKEADKLDVDSSVGPTVSTQPVHQPVSAVPKAHADAVFPKQYQSTVSNNCGISPLFCYYCSLGEVYGQIDGVNMDQTTATCVVFGLEMLFGAAVGAFFPMPDPNQVFALQALVSTLPHYYVRTKVNATLGIEEDVVTTFGIAYCCRFCSAQQMKIEMASRAKAK